nr:hypothetical protein [uncultured Holophaga sp.]
MQNIALNRRFRGMAALGASLSLVFLLTACGGSHSSTTPSTPTTTLTITADNASITANQAVTSLVVGDTVPTSGDSSKSLTLTVDGVETPIAANTTYTSTGATGVVLELTDLIEVDYSSTYVYDWRTAVYINDGAPVLSKSVASAVQGITLSESLTSLDGATIVSVGPGFNGIVATATDADSAGSFKINNLSMNLTGNGCDDFASTADYVEYGNDFSGVGAGVVTQGYANVTLNSPSIITDGVTRTAVLVKEHSTMQCNDGYIQTGGGQLADDATLNAAYWAAGFPYIIQGGYMVSPPWMLGIKGDCRATNLLDYGTATYNDTTFNVKNWGALSVDTNTSVRLNVNNCDVTVTDSGYGSYTIGGDSKVYYNNCTVNVPDMAIIGANGAASAYFRNDNVTSRRFGMMVWGNSGGTFEADGGVWSTSKAMFILKTAWSDISIKNGASITSANGRILETVENDDNGGGPTNGSGTATLTIDGSNTALTGDIIHGNANGELDVVISSGASVTGAITTATATAESTLDGVTKNSYEATSYMSAFDYTYGQTSGVLNVTLADSAAGPGSTAVGSTWTLTAPKANNAYTGSSASLAPTNLVYVINSLTIGSMSSLVVGEGISVSIQEYASDGTTLVGSPITLSAGEVYTSSLNPTTTGNIFKLTVTES